MYVYIRICMHAYEGFFGGLVNVIISSSLGNDMSAYMVAPCKQKPWLT